MKRATKVFSSQQLRIVIEDCMIPFIIGFVSVSLYFWITGDYNAGDHYREKSGFARISSKDGQVYLKRHGIQENDVNVLIQEETNGSRDYQESQNDEGAVLSHSFIQETIRASVRNGIRSSVQNKSKYLSGKGKTWDWPRIESKAPAYPLVWVVTPTYRNPYQYAELTRVAQAMYPARKFVRWLLVDDTKKKDEKLLKRHMRRLKTFLGQFKINFTLLRAIPKSPKQKVIYNPKGVEGRRTALDYIRKNKLEGVVYFADDDNTYDSDIFRQIQSTKTVSIWPTGAITQWIVSSPVVNKEGKVVEFFDGWISNRKFPVDFASFAVNADLIHKNPKANIPWIQGYEETVFLRSLNTKLSEFKPLAENATQVLTWHTKTIKTKSPKRKVYDAKWPSSVKFLMNKYDFLFE